MDVLTFVTLILMILSFLFFTFLAYLLFKLVFDFVIPIYKTTKKVKRTFREMKANMEQHTNGNAPQPQQETTTSAPKKTTVGDYIDFEEVKD